MARMARITSQAKKAIQRPITPISNPTKTVTNIVPERLAFGTLSVGRDADAASSGCLSEGVGICAFWMRAEIERSLSKS